MLAPVVRGRKGEYVDLFRQLQSQGFSRTRVNGETYPLTEPPNLDKQKKHTIEVVVDRLAVKRSAKQRLTDSVETALGLSGGLVTLDFVDLSAEDPHRERIFSEHLACTFDDLSFEELEPRSFSFNSPFGACADCHGLGTRMIVDPELIVPDPGKSLLQGAISPWASAHVADYFIRLLDALADEMGFSTDTAWQLLPGKAREAVLHGRPGKLHVRYKNRYGRERSYYAQYEGVLPYIQRRHGDAETDTSRERFEGFMREVPCLACDGARLKPISLAVTIGDKNIAEVCALPVDEAAAFLTSELRLSERERQIAERVLKEINERLRFLLDVGLDYLTLNRPTGSLSGGEAQRIRLATQIGAGLVGVLYVLDEPSIGLHQRDNHRLIETLVRLKDLGNTLIVVEHDEDTIRTADWAVDIGPGAGEHGGEVVYSGPVEGQLKAKRSLTGQYLSGKRSIPVPEVRRDTGDQWISIKGAREHNLQGLDADIPLGCFVTVTGVSGSGKSTLINDILLRALMQRIYHSKIPPGRHKRIEGIEHLDKVIDIDQSPIGRTPRSNPATYTGVFDHVRKLFAQTQEAKVRGYLPGRFSFNVKGGRCEACSGDGTIKIEMHFLPDVFVPCEVCKGARYNRDTLDITFRDRTIADVLDMPCEEALEFFANQPAISRHMRTLVDVGLGYVRLGQPAPTLSGGEAQRIKLASELSKRSTGHTIYLLDEPTTGLHFEDIRKLLAVLSRLVDAGNTVLVIEHNLDVIKTADWVLDLGPEGGHGGGQIVAEGPPEHIAKTVESYTGHFLAPLLGVER